MVSEVEENLYSCRAIDDAKMFVKKNYDQALVGEKKSATDIVEQEEVCEQSEKIH